MLNVTFEHGNVTFEHGNVTYEHGTNISDYDSFLVLLTQRINIVFTPIIILVGFVGNGVTMAIFMSRALRGTSCSLFLTSRACSDTAFLVSLGCVWIHTMGASLLSYSFMCHMVVYVTYVSSFLSAWFVVLVTFENFIRIRYPYRVPVYCTLYKARCSVILFVMIGMFIYAFALGTVRVDESQGCTPRTDRALLIVLMTYIDAVVALIVPSLVIFLLVFTTCHRVVIRVKNSDSQLPTISCRLQTQVIRLLLAVSMSFLVLNVPSYVVKIQYIINATILHQDATVRQYFVLSMLNLLFYCSFSVNIVIYLAFGRNFRKVCIAVLSKGYCVSCRRMMNNNDRSDVEFSDYPTVIFAAVDAANSSQGNQANVSNGLCPSKPSSAELTSLV